MSRTNRLRPNRILKLAIDNFGRNMFLSIATIMMMGMILFIFNVVFALNILTKNGLEQVAEKVDLILYLNKDASLLEISEITNKINELPYVKEIIHTGKEEALQNFIEIYPDKADPFTLYGINNPLPGNIRVLTESPEDHEKVLKEIEKNNAGNLFMTIKSNNENTEITQRLIQITNFTERLIFGLTLTFILGGILMIANAIHLSIFTRRKEIQIMQLVGASSAMIHLPFIVEGLIYGGASTFFSAILLFFFLESTGLHGGFTGFGIETWMIFFSIELLAGLSIGAIASLIATKHYLSKNL